MAFEDDEKAVSEKLKRFMKQIDEQSARETAALSVVRMLGTHLQDGGELPKNLALSIGGCLEDYVDGDGNNPDPDVQRLFREVMKVCGYNPCRCR